MYNQKVARIETESSQTRLPGLLINSQKFLHNNIIIHSNKNKKLQNSNSAYENNSELMQPARNMPMINKISHRSLKAKSITVSSELSPVRLNTIMSKPVASLRTPVMSRHINSNGQMMRKTGGFTTLNKQEARFETP